MINKEKRVLVIVVTYNGDLWVDYCFGCLQSSSIPIDILCIDNNSSDNTVTSIRERHPDVEIIESSENLGFGKANNIGLKRCIEKEYDYAFLLNQDARIEPETIEKLILTHLNNQEYGILSPIHRSSSNSSLDLNFSSYLNHQSTPNLISDALLGNPLQDVYSSGFVNAALWLISKKCLDTVGFFDPIFPHYGEDVDYAIRTIRADFKIGIVPKALGNHARDNAAYSAQNNKLSTIANKQYVELILEYKKNYRISSIKKIMYFLLKMVNRIFRHLIMLEFKFAYVTLKIFFRLFYNLPKIDNNIKIIY